MPKYRAKISSNAMINESLYIIEKKGWFMWNYLSYKYAGTPLAAIRLAKEEEQLKRERDVWTYDE